MRRGAKRMEYSIQQVAKAAGTTSRALRHYDSVGLVPPSRIGLNGYRYYDDLALVRLQRVLLLRELGLGLDAIGRVLAAQDSQAAGRSPGEAEAEILARHLELLRQEQRRIESQIGSVERTIAALATTDAHTIDDEGAGLMAEKMFDGFDHTQYREEVEQRWGADAYAKSDDWWRGLGAEGQADWKRLLAELNGDWARAAQQGEDPASPAAQDLARRHVEWLRGVPHTPASTEGGDLSGYVLGLGEMYVADERFAANYGGPEGAAFVRDALRAYMAQP